MSQHLKFEHEKGAGRSKYVAGALVLLIVGWMSSGMILPKEEAPADPTPAEQASAPIAVAMIESAAEAVPQILTAEGQSRADRETAIRAEAGGTIDEVLAQKGDMVSAGQILARIAPAQREADLARAEAERARARRELDNAETLLDRGISTQDRVISARSALAAAEAGLANAREAMNNLEIAAPFSGRLEDLSIEPGEMVSAGAQIGLIVDLDPLRVAIQIPQQSVALVSQGQPAQVEFVTGSSSRGEVGFVGASANPQTRTFEAEILVPNPQNTVPAGISAAVLIPTGETRAHFLSPAILSLDAEGALGVKAVGEGNTVAFYPVEIVRAETNGLWVSGLPDQLQVITVGQGFVNAGEVVDPRPAETLDPGESTE